ncbi:aldehyde dehydrogenase family protein [Stygiolobus caldivivus]|uniref:Aldehyde dehydrogenase n=1 Tax=Stygiolobus caldivivus TaxID=2824673 RepID=A0A8D5U6A0_9CREN|nr:aldehyde dehydrogenase family protein [Stygiolobus caldivivus]BCU70098.1 aldehyde dehydrogenase [Stygiolobus caldivivus]
MFTIIGNEKVDSGEKIPVRNPATGEVIDYVPSLPREEVKNAIDIALDTSPRLNAIAPAKRSRLLTEVAKAIRGNVDDLAVTMTRETGRPIKSSRLEIERTAQIFELAASELRRALEGQFIPLDLYELPAGNENRVAFVKREPLGVVAAITPFNFPAASFAHKVAPALAVGNTVVFKPSSLTPLTQLKLAQLVLKEFPPGSLNVVTGNSEMIGDEFVSNEKVSLITFTGSASVGLDLASRAVKNGKRVIMELGGSDAMVVLEDADIDKAVRSALVGRFDFAGQFCNATKRVIVRREVEEEFTEKLKSGLQKFRAGDPMDEGVDIPPLISSDAVARMKEFLNDALAAGGEEVYEGKVPDKGYYFPPVVLRLSPESKARVLREEVFGPILPVVPVSSDEEAVRVANSTQYGLDASVFTKDFSRAYEIASKLKAGTVVINDTTRLRWDNLPFGGVLKSGIGRESVINTMLEMTETKLVVYSR